MRADTLKSLVENDLWNTRHQFFETMRTDSSANVREAIGYIPWYFNLPDTTKKYEVAWKEIMDEKGYSAPYGMTTAERRHPELRPRGVGKCERDGDICVTVPFQKQLSANDMAADTAVPREEYTLIIRQYNIGITRLFLGFGEYELTDQSEMLQFSERIRRVPLSVEKQGGKLVIYLIQESEVIRDIPFCADGVFRQQIVKLGLHSG